MNAPKIFISSISGDVTSARQITKEALLNIKCHPVEQTTFESDWLSVERWFAFHGFNGAEPWTELGFQ